MKRTTEPSRHPISHDGSPSRKGKKTVDEQSAEQALGDFRKRFIDEMDADEIIFDLEEDGIINNGDQTRIAKINGKKLKNKDLYACLKEKCTKETLLKVCDRIDEIEGNPKMKDLGKDMRKRLAQDPAPSPPTQGGTQPNAVEVCPALPEPLQHARRLAYSRYQRPTFAEGQKVQFTKVAVLEGAPKAREKGDINQGEFLKRYHDCGVRLSEGATEQVTVDDFLHKGNQQNRIIYGQPGTGKTTFLRHLCQKVARNEGSDFSLVLYFPLRDKAVSQALKGDSEAGLEQLLGYYIPGKKCSASSDALLESEGENVLIIFDGADEVRGLMDSSEGSLLASLLQGRLLPQAHFIVSTRPSGCPLLQEHSTLFYEILGFDEESVKSYVKDFFKSEPGKGEAMLSDLRARPDLMGGVYIPMNLLIFCSIYEHDVAGMSAFPATMTECYKSHIARIVTRQKRKEKRTYQIAASLTDLPPDVEHLLSSLGVLAFNGLNKEPPDYIFQEADVRPLFSFPPNQSLDESFFIGLLHLHASQEPGYSTHSTLNFSHTTKQEFFAAYHLSMLPEAEQVAFWRENHHNPKFAVVLRYFAGLTCLKTVEVSEAILATGGDLPSECTRDNPFLLYVFHALFESQNESLTQSIATQLNSCLAFGLYLTPFDTMVLSHCLTKCKHLTLLSTRGYSLTPISFHHVCSVVQCNPLLQSLSLAVDQFSTEDARALCQVAGSLKWLRLEIYERCTFEAVAEVFDHRPLEELELHVYSDVDGDVDGSVVEKKVAHCQLKSLRLIGDITLLLPVLSGVKDNRSITHLDVDGDMIHSDETSSAVATCVQTMPQLRMFGINEINPLPVLQSLSHRGSPLDSFTVNYPQWWVWEFSEEDWALLEEAASCAQVVTVQVNVDDVDGESDSGVDHSDRASRALAAGFSKNPLLTEVALGMVPEELVESVRGTLCTNTALTVTVIDDRIE